MKSTKVSVPKGTGEIVITPGYGEPLRYAEVDGAVDVPDAELESFLLYVSGSKIAPAPKAPDKEK